MTALACGCCGQGFEGTQGTENDEGFGTCPDCEDWIESRHEKQLRGYTARFARALNKTNRRVFLKMPINMQVDILSKALDDGIITWKIGRSGG